MASKLYLGETHSDLVRKFNELVDGLDGKVSLTGAETISGEKTFAAPTNVSGSEVVTTWFNTANGGRVGFGKEAANSGTGIFFDQVSGTRRLNFRASATAGAMVWEQPESNSGLYLDVNNVFFRAANNVQFTKFQSAGYLYTDSSGNLKKGTMPTSLKNPNALTFGSKTYDGSIAQTITAEDIGALPITGGTLTGNLSGQYITGSWLQTTAATDLGRTPPKYAVIDESGWIYTRTLSEMKSDLNVPTKSSWNYDDAYVKYSAAQTLTDSQKSQARSNIGAELSGAAANALASAKLYADTAILNLVNSAPETLDTLGELAKAIQDHEDEYDALLQTVGSKAKKTTQTATVLGTSKTTEAIGEYQLVFPKGAIFSGTAANAGLVTRGICGVSTPDANGSCDKENLYINYDSTNNYNAARQLVLQAGQVGTHYGNNLYQYCAARGDAVKGYCDATYLKPSGVTVTQKLTSGEEIGSIKVGSTTTKLYAPSGSSITIDSELSNTSTNPVQNKVINDALNETNNNIGLAIADLISDIEQGDITCDTASHATYDSAGNNISKSRNRIWYGTCGTASATTEKVGTCSGFSLYEGATILLKMTNTSTSTSNNTLNVNGTGAKTIYTSNNIPVRYTSTYTSGYQKPWGAGDYCLFTYDGTYWVWVNAPRTRMYYSNSTLYIYDN